MSTPPLCPNCQQEGDHESPSGVHWNGRYTRTPATPPPFTRTTLSLFADLLQALVLEQPNTSLPPRQFAQRKVLIGLCTDALNRERAAITRSETQDQAK